MPLQASIINAFIQPIQTGQKQGDGDTGKGKGERDTGQGHREGTGQEQGLKTGTGARARTGKLRIQPQLTTCAQPARTNSTHNLLCTNSAGCVHKYFVVDKQDFGNSGKQAINQADENTIKINCKVAKTKKKTKKGL